MSRSLAIVERVETETGGRVIDSFVGEIGEQGKARLLGLKVAGRRQYSPLDDPGLHSSKNLRLSPHLENFYIAIGLQAPFLEQQAQRTIGRGAVTGNSQDFAFKSSCLLIDGCAKR